MQDENIQRPVILVDLDGTLAIDDGNYVEGKIGWPVRKILEFVKYQIGMGNEVRIFTARADNPVDVEAISNWLLDEAELPCSRDEYNKLAALGHPPQRLAITNIKTKDVVLLIDDKARECRKNTGEIVGLGTAGHVKPVFKLTNRKPFSISR